MSTYAFIDSQNLLMALKTMGWDLDVVAFRRYLLEKYKVTNAYWFVGYLPERELEYKKLREAGFFCIFKPTFRSRNGAIKGNCDAELVLHSMINLDRYDRAVLVSGDGDFHCLVEHWLGIGRAVKILAPRQHNCSHLLGNFGNSVQISYVAELRNKIEHKKSLARTNP
jgi:uncharacterized LabA/DUF88 family protein